MKKWMATDHPIIELPFPEGKMAQLKRNLLSVALATATMMLALQVQAQEAAQAAATPGAAAKAKKKADDAKNLD
ncbi:hypothetical protein, partial [Thermomonas sp.]